MLNMEPIVGESFAEIYKKALEKCYYSPHYETAPRGLKIKELVNQTLVLTNPVSNLFVSSSRSPDFRYLAGELIWYYFGDNSLNYIEKYSKFWKRIVNDDGTLESAYGNLIFKEKNEFGKTEWQWAVDSLIKDKDNRQAIFHINKPKHQKDNCKDFPCTVFGQFLIRNNELNLSVTMRSNDFWFGLTYDLPFFTSLQQTMLKILIPHYPELKLGKYYHTANSLHIYEKDFESVEKFLSNENEILKEGLPEIEIPPVDSSGNSYFVIKDLFYGKPYNGNDKFFSWLYNHSK